MVAMAEVLVVQEVRVEAGEVAARMLCELPSRLSMPLDASGQMTAGKLLVNDTSGGLAPTSQSSVSMLEKTSPFENVAST